MNYINKYFVNPQTKTPHPPARISAAIDEAKFRVDMDTPIDRQIQECVKKVVDIIPLKKMEMRAIISIPHKHLGVVGGVLHRFATISSERYDGNGCQYEVSIIPGDYFTLLAELENLTKGDFSFEVEGEGPAEAAAPKAKGKAKGAGKAKGKGPK